MPDKAARAPEDRGGEPPAIVVRELAAAYAREVVFRDASFDVRSGEFWFLVGPNGSGKTTFLKCVLGVFRPRAGTVRVRGDIRAEMKIGFVPQRCALKATLPMTVADFVRLGLVGTEIRGRRARANVAWALGEVGLLDKGSSDYWSLSGGQRQRALVARGLVRRPELLLLDEPTSGLDLPAESSFLGLVSRLHGGRGLTVIFVTHAVGLAARYGTHVAVFGGGKVRAGPRDEVLTAANLEEAYGVPVGGAP